MNCNDCVFQKDKKCPMEMCMMSKEWWTTPRKKEISISVIETSYVNNEGFK